MLVPLSRPAPRPLRARAVAVFVVLLLAAPLAFATPGVSEAARLPFANIVPAVAPAGGSLYVLGGLNQTLFDGIVRVDLASGSATNVSRLPVPLAAAAYATTTGGITYTFGGIVPNGTSTKLTDAIGRFDPATETFSWTGAKLPRPDAIGVAVWGDDAFYTMGGAGDVFNITRYDPVSNTVEQIPLPAGLALFITPAARLGDSIYIYGGLRIFPNGTSAWTKEIHRFSLVDHSIELLPEQLPTLVVYGGAQAIGDTVHVFGGIDETGYRQAILRHRPDVGVIETIGASLPGGNILFGSAALGGKAYLVGGVNATKLFDTVLELDAEYEQLVALAQLPGETAVEGAPREGDPRTYEVNAIVLGTQAPTVGVFTNGLLTQPVSVRPPQLGFALDAGVWTDDGTPTCLLSVGDDCLVLLPSDPTNTEPGAGRFRIGVDLYVDGERVNENVAVPFVGSALP